MARDRHPHEQDMTRRARKRYVGKFHSAKQRPNQKTWTRNAGITRLRYLDSRTTTKNLSLDI